MMKEKSKVMFSVMSAGVGVCLILNLILQAVAHHWQTQRDDMRFQMLDQRIVQGIQQTGAYAMSSRGTLQKVTRQDAASPSNDRANPASEGAVAKIVTVTDAETSRGLGYFADMSGVSQQKLDTLRKQEASLTRCIGWGTLVASTLLVLAFILNIFTIYYGTKIYLLYKT